MHPMLPSEFTSVGEGAGKAKRRGREEVFENSQICSEKKGNNPRANLSCGFDFHKVGCFS